MRGYRLKRREKPGAGLRRVVVEGIAEVRRELKGVSADPHGVVHRARRRLKRLRTAARLMRAGADGPAREAGARFAEAAQVLSETRDDDVAAATAAALARSTKSPAAKRAFARAERALRQRLASSKERFGDIATALAALEEAERTIQAMDLHKLNRRALKEALLRIDRRAAAAWARTKKPNAPETSRHEWRKRVKDRWHVTDLLKNVWPKRLRRRAKTADLLGETLGDERDLALLHHRLNEDPSLCGGPAALRSARAAIGARKAELRRRAEKLGRRLHG